MMPTTKQSQTQWLRVNGLKSELFVLNEQQRLFVILDITIYMSCHLCTIQSTPPNLNRSYTKILFELHDDSNFQVLEACPN